MQDQQEGQELHFDLVNATFSPNKGVVCHIVASWNKDNISDAEAMLKNIDNIEVFECIGGEGEHEEEHDHEDEEHELPIRQLENKEKNDFINSFQHQGGHDEEYGSHDMMVGGGLTKNPQLITTSSLVKFLSKMAKQ